MLSSAEMKGSVKAVQGRKVTAEGMLTPQANHPQPLVPMASGKAWSSADNMATLFSPSDTPTASGAGQLPQGPDMQMGHPTVAPRGGEAKGAPAW